MMVVPRSYQQSPLIPPSSSKSIKADDASRLEGRSSKGPGRSTSSISAMTPSILTLPAATPSKPMVIPTRSFDGSRRKNKGLGEEKNGRSKRDASPHDPSSIAPSVAALLAMTSIPQRRQGARAEVGHKRQTSHSICNWEARNNEASRRALSSSSPQTWDLLLSPPIENGFEIGSYESDTTLGPLSSIRSQSTESMPSLETDEESLNSPGSPVTPGLSYNNRNDRRPKSLSNSNGEACLFNHPLLPPPAHTPDADIAGDASTLSPEPSPAPKPRSSFRSNLTASLQVLRSAARSVSNFTALPIQRDDYLSRALLSYTPPFTDEPRPLPSEQPPDKALRRYLNPIILSAAELHYHTEQDNISCKSSIQLQTYQPGAQRSSKASSPPIFMSKQQRQPVHLSKNSLDMEDAQTSSLLPRQREPRENSDFLRVIVLEMNMRKLGKLGETSPGRARLWLPARQLVKSGTSEIRNGRENVKDESAGEQRDGGVPLRWIGVVA